MIDILVLILPIFLLIGAGYGAVRLDLVTQAQIGGLGAFVLNFALPALVLNALAGQDLTQTFNGGYILAYAGGSLVSFLAIFALVRFGLGRPLAHAAVAGLGSSASNTGFIGFPVASLVLGPPALIALPLTMLVENLLIVPLALALGEAGGQVGQDRQSLRKTIVSTAWRLIRMPLILAIILGAILSSTGMHLPGPVEEAIAMMARASVPCAVFVVGGTVAGLKLSGIAGETVWPVLGKLVLHPLAVAAGFGLVGGVPPELAATGIVFASVPMFTVYPILAGRFNLGGMAAGALVVATGLGLLSITVALGLVLGHQ